MCKIVNPIINAKTFNLWQIGNFALGREIFIFKILLFLAYSSGFGILCAMVTLDLSSKKYKEFLWGYEKQNITEDVC